MEVAESAYFHEVDETIILNTLQSRMAVMAGDLQIAENIFLENENTDGAVNM